MFYTYILLFFIYSFLGWCMEVGLSLFNEKKFINRGFLLGPYCPIYGCGVLLLTMLLSGYKDDVFALFALTFFICSFLEYVTSWIMEKIFKLRWWDYSNLKFNINGRICLETMLPFAIIGVLCIMYVNPFFIGLIDKISNIIKTIVTILLITLIVVDYIISCNVTFNLKRVTKNVKKDSTEEIKNAIHKFIQDNSILYDRIINAFPKISRIQIKELIEKNKKKRKK